MEVNKHILANNYSKVNVGLIQADKLDQTSLAEIDGKSCVHMEEAKENKTYNSGTIKEMHGLFFAR